MQKQTWFLKLTIGGLGSITYVSSLISVRLLKISRVANELNSSQLELIIATALLSARRLVKIWCACSILVIVFRRRPLRFYDIITWFLILERLRESIWNFGCALLETFFPGQTIVSVMVSKDLIKALTILMEKCHVH